MEYERIHKVQTGIISPSKLRAKLMGPHSGSKRMNGDSVCNSSRASPSKHGEDSEFVKSGLLSSLNGSAPSDENVLAPLTNSAPPLPPTHGSGYCNSKVQRRNHAVDGEGEALDDEVVFEFHEGERSLCVSMATVAPSKWNDAEKWVASSRHGKAHFPSNKAAPALSHAPVRVAPADHDHRLPSTENFAFNFPSHYEIYDLHPRREVCNKATPAAKPSPSCSDGGVVRPVAMKDTGTEMTPIPSQEPSATPTPRGVETPTQTPSSSTPSTPGRCPNKKLQETAEGTRRELSEEETKENARKEIAELGTQLGKTKIAEWARTGKGYKCTDSAASPVREENVKRAWAWEEARKAKHFARYKREEIKIEAWESQHKAKLEAQMMDVKTRVEQMRARARAEMVKKMAMAMQRSEERKAAAMMRRNRETERVARQAKLIRKTGRISPSFMCCKWF